MAGVSHSLCSGFNASFGDKKINKMGISESGFVQSPAQGGLESGESAPDSYTSPGYCGYTRGTLGYMSTKIQLYLPTKATVSDDKNNCF